MKDFFFRQPVFSMVFNFVNLTMYLGDIFFYQCARQCCSIKGEDDKMPLLSKNQKNAVEKSHLKDSPEMRKNVKEVKRREIKSQSQEQMEIQHVDQSQISEGD